jgi:hypothetical protein
LIVIEFQTQAAYDAEITSHHAMAYTGVQKVVAISIHGEDQNDVSRQLS